jgi:hypothetical protein
MKSRVLALLTVLGIVASAPAAPQRSLLGLVHGDTVFVVGAHEKGRGWLDDNKAKPLFKTGQAFGVWNLTSRVGQTKIGPVMTNEPIPGWSAVGSRNFGDKTLLAISSPYVSRRVPRVQNVNQAVYLGVVQNILRQNKLAAAKARLTQNLRVDLNGDGRDEVILAAHSRAQVGREPRILKNDYAFLALRFVRNGKVSTQLLEREFYAQPQSFAAPNRFEILGCRDLDGDGTLEIIAHSAYYEGDAVTVWKFDGKSARVVLAAGWGV